MASKNNIRSMRFTDATIEIIESMAGSNFTAKFEALVNKCIWELPRREEELKCIQAIIQKEYERLGRIRNKASKLEQQVNSLQYGLQSMNSQVNRSLKSLEELIDEK